MACLQLPWNKATKKEKKKTAWHDSCLYVSVSEKAHKTSFLGFVAIIDKNVVLKESEDRNRSKKCRKPQRKPLRHLLCLCLLISKYRFTREVSMIISNNAWLIKQRPVDKWHFCWPVSGTHFTMCCIKHYIVLWASFESLCLHLVSTGVWLLFHLSNSNPSPLLTQNVYFYRPYDFLQHLSLECTSINRHLI